jgi:phosphoserine phosphatase
MRNAVAIGLQDLDRTLIQSPVIGPIYEAWFRKESYYRHDTRLMYLEIVSGVVKHLAEDAVAAKGLKFAKQYEQGPILGELYKPVAPSAKIMKSD